jgi:hypothetical protein
MFRALNIDLGRNKTASIMVFDATVTVKSQFAVHLGKESVEFAHGGLLITSDINVHLVRHCEVFRLRGYNCFLYFWRQGFFCPYFRFCTPPPAWDAAPAMTLVIKPAKRVNITPPFWFLFFILQYAFLKWSLTREFPFKNTMELPKEDMMFRSMASKYFLLSFKYSARMGSQRAWCLFYPCKLKGTTLWNFNSLDPTIWGSTMSQYTYMDFRFSYRSMVLLPK